MSFDYIPTEEQDAYILTKALERSKFEIYKDMIGVADNPFLVERECWNGIQGGFWFTFPLIKLEEKF